jgi:argininosuccinate lyase
MTPFVHWVVSMQVPDLARHSGSEFDVCEEGAEALLLLELLLLLLPVGTQHLTSPGNDGHRLDTNVPAQELVVEMHVPWRAAHALSGAKVDTGRWS